MLDLKQCTLAAMFFAVMILTVYSTTALVQGAESQAKIETVSFLDSGSFDRKLSSALRKQAPQVKVEFVSPITTNSIPDRIDKWFAMVEKHEGTISLKPDPDVPADRGILSELLSLVIGVYNYAKDKYIYDPVSQYDVIVYYQKGSGKITRIMFIQKK